MHFRFWHPAVWPALRHTGNTLPVRLKLSPLRGDGSRHDDERDPRGLPSEQTADRFASLFLYHILPLEVMIMLKYEVSLPFSLETRNNFTYIDKKVV